MAACNTTLHATSSTLHNIHSTLDDVSNDFLRADFSQLRTEIAAFKYNYKALVQCVDEFPDELRHMTSDVESIVRDVERAEQDMTSKTVDFDYEQQIRPLRDAETQLDAILYKYSHGTIAKTEYLRQLTNSDATLQKAELFRENVVKLVQALKGALSAVEAEVLDAFKKASLKTRTLSFFFDQDFLADRANVRHLFRCILFSEYPMFLCCFLN